MMRVSRIGSIIAVVNALLLLSAPALAQRSAVSAAAVEVSASAGPAPWYGQWHMWMVAQAVCLVLAIALMVRDGRDT